MSLQLLPSEVITIIALQFIQLSGTELRPEKVYIQYREWNFIYKAKTLLAFANSCKYLRSVLYPLIFENFGMHLDTSKTFPGCVEKRFISKNSMQFKGSPSLINFQSNFNFVFSWNARSGLVPLNVLAHVKHLFVCRVRNHNYQVRIWPSPGFINSKHMPSLREVTIFVKSGCEENHVPDFTEFAKGVKTYKKALKLHVYLPLTYWDHDIGVLDFLDIYPGIESLSLICCERRFLSNLLMSLVSQMKNLRRLLIGFIPNFEDGPDVEMDDDEREDTNVLSDGWEIAIQEENEQDFGQFEANSGVDNQISLLFPECPISDHVSLLGKLEKLEVFGFRYYHPLTFWRTPISLRHLCISIAEFSVVRRPIPAIMENVEHLEVIPSSFDGMVNIPFTKLKSLTIPFCLVEYYELILQSNPNIVNLTFTEIRYSEYSKLPTMPELLEKLELQYFYTHGATHDGKMEYKKFENLLVGPELRSVYIHMPVERAFSFQTLLNVIEGNNCPKLSLIYLTIPLDLHEGLFPLCRQACSGSPRERKYEKFIPPEEDAPRAMYGEPDILNKLLTIFQEDEDSLVEAVPQGSSITDFCYPVDIHPPRYRREDYHHIIRVPFLGKDEITSHFVIEVDSLRRLIEENRGTSEDSEDSELANAFRWPSVSTSDEDYEDYYDDPE